MYKLSEIIVKANTIHNGKYEYDESTYVKMTEKMRIICPIHGEFWQSMHQHINKRQGCPSCAKNIHRERNENGEKKSREGFFKECRQKFGNRFKYNEDDYINLGSRIRIICPTHNEYTQIANVHLNSLYGCPMCANEAVSRNSTSNENEFIKKAQKIHENKYDYSKVKYINVNTKVTITCPMHGDFDQFPYNHLTGNGCPECGRIKTSNSNRLTQEEFIKKSNQIHKNYYDYSKVKYISSKEKVCIICPKHGEFWQAPDKHIQGEGCPKCGNILSKAENEIYEFCCNLLGKENISQGERTMIRPYELDIYIPSKKIGIEYNGLRWHSEKFGKDRQYHLNKLKMCRERGIKLIQIFEDEYVNKRDIVLSKIQHLLGMSPGGALCKFYGRNCDIREIGKDAAKSFLEKNHIQGYARSSIYLGAFYHDHLIAVMSFKKENDDKWELTRFASDIDLICSGVGGKLFKYFVRVFNPKEVKSFADRRWTIDENNLYTKLGFKFDKYTEPDYSYCKEGEIIRHHKFGFRKQFLSKKYGLPLSITESEMTESLGYYKVWNCGLIKYVWQS